MCLPLINNDKGTKPRLYCWQKDSDLFFPLITSIESYSGSRTLCDFVHVVRFFLTNNFPEEISMSCN